MLTKSLHITSQKRPRPTMLGHPKYRHKEEKRKLMKMTCKKLKKLEDPESVLCKAVLINNTWKYLQNTQININLNQSQTLHLQQDEPDNESIHKSELDLDILNNEIEFPPPSYDNISSENDFLKICNSEQAEKSTQFHEAFSNDMFNDDNSNSTLKKNYVGKEQQISFESTQEESPLQNTNSDCSSKKFILNESMFSREICSEAGCDNFNLSLYNLPLHRIC